MSKVLIATEKPFAAPAVAGIKQILTEAGFEVVLLEKYTAKAELLAAVADVEAIISSRSSSALVPATTT